MSDFYKPIDGKKQLQEMINDTPTPTKCTFDPIAPDQETWWEEIQRLKRELVKATEQQNRLAEACRNLIKAKGRYNTEIAFNKRVITLASGAGSK